MNYILLIIGFFLLIKGADIFVDGASGISKKLGIPSVIVGLTIVSLGTSAPELAVSIVSSLQGSNEIAVGNVLGSNIFNTLMVFGVTLIIMPLIIKKSTIKKDFLINIAVTTLFLLLTFNGILLGKENYISRFDGFILLSGCILYILFLIWTVKGQKVGKSKDVAAEMAIEDEGIEHINIPKSIISLIIGAICIVIGGNIVVDSASSIATALGMSDKLVGLTIVAMGTSLPELVTSAMAALKGEEDMALGNILGSNIFNILLIIGASSIITPMIVSSTLIVDFIFLILVTILIGILIFAHKGKEKRLGKLEGILFVSLYIGYMVYIIFRN
ncbi:calcium/sodium antiporter [Clostridium sp. NSJ-49]|uniref:calcium/sodium antiporter n=1 Tax=Clostridium TaxID=1485 RepID=UPI00164A8CFF|nr:MULTISPECIES: calcium/sodium antiporter [unclassified Clostridium]MBC5626113.1 calcium/sodium antiporter [Clostridium sp. NSJ-49]MCD2500497.1 calcium/sodium antiporter [Clostridium sp. NSJ-145]MDU6339969.1 calcium/sodium antiporter [Clostridium sp.]